MPASPSPPLQPLSARSIVLSLLLGAHPPEMHTRQLVAAAGHFGVAESALRVALTRMVSTGDLERTDGVHRLNARLLERQRRQDESIDSRTAPWAGQWHQVVVMATGRAPADRARLRTELDHLRLAELREGVWMRPANLDLAWPADVGRLLAQFTATPSADAADLVRSLWDLPAWAAEGRALIDILATVQDPLVRLTAAAATVQHVTKDPMLPEELLPHDWPGRRLRETYAAFRSELIGIAESFRSA